MKIKFSMTHFLVLVGLFSFSTDQLAQEFNNLLDGDLVDLEIGAGYVAGNKFREEFDGDENEAYYGPAPLFRARIAFLEIGNVPNTIGFDAKGFRLGTMSFYTGDSYETTGLERDAHFFIGGFFGYGPLIAYAYTDVGDTSNGSVYNIRFSPLLYKGGKSTLHWVLEAGLMNSNYVNYFFGVDQNAVDLNPNLNSLYLGEDTYTGETRLVYNSPLGKRWRFIAWTALKWHGRGISDSPTVKSPYRIWGGLGWLYTFF